MVVLTGPGEANFVRWSPTKQNNKPFSTVKEGMLRRLKDNFDKGTIKPNPNRIQVIQFYENGSLIDKQTVNWIR